MMIKKLAPVLIVDRIEPLLPLWDALGFQRTAEVPHGEGLGFVILARDGIEVMYQTRDSVRADEPKVLEGAHPPGAAALFIEVDDVEAMAGALPAGTDVVNARRTTFYGSTETIFRDGAGNLITLAQMS
jgi:catechol 2,3-dioxygenase-like lactoylglutathione lyase family enzyme